MRIEEMPIAQGSPLVGKNLREAGIGQHTGAIVVGINGPDGRTRVNPTATSTISSVILKEGDILIALGNDEQLGRLEAFVRRGK